MRSGYSYGSKFWKNGYAKEVLKSVIEYLLKETEIILVEAKHIQSNVVSGIVMENAGMKKEAILRQRRVNKQTKEVEDLAIYSITKDEIIDIKTHI